MFYIIYKITNRINGKIYIGKHQTKNLNDGYMGSGKHIKRAISKYGIDNFKKEILFQFDNELEMNVKESELVTEEFCLSEDTYNLCPGGNGGFGYINSNPEIMAKRDKYENKLAGRIAANEVLKAKYGTIAIVPLKLKTDEEFRSNFRKNVSAGLKRKYSETEHNWKNRHHTEETKQKMRKPKNIGSSNSQYGTRWITNGIENRKIEKETPIPKDWRKGRVIKQK
jgi:hypothetical protein